MRIIGISDDFHNIPMIRIQYIDVNYSYIPYIVNDIDLIYDKFVEKLDLINKDNLIKISHIEYTPNEVDKERFLL